MFILQWIMTFVFVSIDSLIFLRRKKWLEVKSLTKKQY
ncbi:hypothetical protein EH2_00787 [Bacillus subtilis]|nr:hypothetical protein EH2_00787 [Bacillus subtilis]